MAFSYSVRSDIGKKRKQNQDNYLWMMGAKWALFVVCDGMGGAAAGDRASAIAVDHIFSKISALGACPGVSDLRNAIDGANTAIFKESCENPQMSGMGTTVSALVLNEDHYYFGHVGDSRLYNVRNGQINLLTEDHTWAEALKSTGAISEEDASSSPAQHMLTRSLGVTEPIEIDISEVIQLPEESIFILCTDGFYNLVPDEEILSLVEDPSGKDLESLVDTLVSLSLDRGGSDNITLFCIQASLSEKSQRFDPVSGEFAGVVDSGIGTMLREDYVYKESEDDELFSFDAFSSSPKPGFLLIGKSAISTLLLSFIVIAALIFGIKLTRDTEKTVNVVGHDPRNAVSYGGGLDHDAIRISPHQGRKLNILTSLHIREVVEFEEPSLNAYLVAKGAELLTVPGQAPEVFIPSEKSLRPELIRPIVWENESQRLKLMRVRSAANKEKPEDLLAPPDSPIDSPVYSADIYDVLTKKNSLRERLIDLDERLRQLAFADPERYKRVLDTRREVIHDELLKVRDVQARFLSDLMGLEMILKGENFDAIWLSQVSSVFAAGDGSFQILQKRIDVVTDAVRYYSRLLKRVDESRQAEVISQIAARTVELGELRNELRDEVFSFSHKNKQKIQRILNMYGVVDDLLEKELSRVNRAEGIRSGIAELPDYGSAGFVKTLQADRRRLYGEYSRLLEQVSLRRELGLLLSSSISVEK